MNDMPSAENDAAYPTRFCPDGCGLQPPHTHPTSVIPPVVTEGDR